MLKIKNIIILTSLAAVFCLALSLPVIVQNSSLAGGQALAVNTDPCHPELHKPPGNKLTTAQLANCEACNNKLDPNAAAKNCLTTNPIVKDVNLIINVLAGLVGIVSVAMLIVGGVQYSIARNNSQTITNARTRMINAGIALVSFIFLWALLQYLVPGGVFNS